MLHTCCVCIHTGTYTYLLSSCAWIYLGSAVSPWPTENETSWWHSDSFCVILLPDSVLNAMSMTPEVKRGLIKMLSLLTHFQKLVLNRCLFNTKMRLTKWVSGRGQRKLISPGLLFYFLRFHVKFGGFCDMLLSKKDDGCQTSQDYITCWWRRWICVFFSQTSTTTMYLCDFHRITWLRPA